MPRRPLALLALLLALAAGCAESPPAPPAPPPAGWDARPIAVSEVRFPALDAAVADLKGKVVVVDFWATWCAPCVKKFPHLVEVQKKYADRGLACVSVSLDKASPDAYDAGAVLAFLRQKDARFPNFVMTDPEADDGALKKRFGKGDGIPFLVVLDRAGRPVWNSDDDVKNTKNEAEELDAVLVRLLGAE